MTPDGVRKQEILHTAESLFHDHLPANKAGLASAWIYRRHGQQGFGATQPPGTMPHADLAREYPGLTHNDRWNFTRFTAEIHIDPVKPAGNADSWLEST